MNIDAKYPVLDDAGNPAGVIDLAVIRRDSDALFTELLNTECGDSEAIVDLALKATTDAGLAGGIVLVDVLSQLMGRVIGPLIAKLQALGVSDAEIFDLIKLR